MVKMWTCFWLKARPVAGMPGRYCVPAGHDGRGHDCRPVDGHLGWLEMQSAEHIAQPRAGGEEAGRPFELAAGVLRIILRLVVDEFRVDDLLRQPLVTGFDEPE
jgi:hypothetical protein